MVENFNNAVVRDVCVCVYVDFNISSTNPSTITSKYSKHVHCYLKSYQHS